MHERDAPSIEQQLYDWADDLASTVPAYEPPSNGLRDGGRGPRRLLSVGAVVVAAAVVGVVVWVAADGDPPPPPPEPATAVEHLHDAVEAALGAPAWQALTEGPLVFEEVVYRAPDRLEWRNGIDEVGTAAIVIGDAAWAYEDGGWSEAGDAGAWAEHPMHGPSQLLDDLAAAECVQPDAGDHPALTVWRTEDGGCGGSTERLPADLPEGSTVWRVGIDGGRVVRAAVREVDEEFPRSSLPLPGDVGPGDPLLEPLNEWLQGLVVVQFAYDGVPEIVPPGEPRPWPPTEVPDDADLSSRVEIAAGAQVAGADEDGRPVWVMLSAEPPRPIELSPASTDVGLVEIAWLPVDPQSPWDVRRDLEDHEAVNLPAGAGVVLVGREGQRSVVRFSCGPDERIDLRSSEDVRQEVVAFAARLSVALDCRGRHPGGQVSGDVGVDGPTECLGLPDDPAACRE